MKRIKHNDLTHYFLRPHQELPRAYLASCEKFFKKLSDKQQASSLTGIKPDDNNRIIKEDENDS